MIMTAIMERWQFVSRLRTNRTRKPLDCLCERGGTTYHTCDECCGSNQTSEFPPLRISRFMMSCSRPWLLVHHQCEHGDYLSVTLSISHLYSPPMPASTLLIPPFAVLRHQLRPQVVTLKVEVPTLHGRGFQPAKLHTPRVHRITFTGLQIRDMHAPALSHPPFLVLVNCGCKFTR